MASSDVLFAKELPVTIKNNLTEDRKTLIKVNVENVNHTSPLHRKELVVRLTDDRDLFFLYTLKLGEEDFQSLKTHQGLLVDFNAFPQKFIDLLELCLRERDHENPKYLLQFMCPPISGTDKDIWSLNVVETNPFKHLTHLSLRFLPGKDADVKAYLADCLKIAKNEINRLDTALRETESSLSSRLHQSQQALSSRSKELESLKIEWESKQQELNAMYSQKVTSEKEKAFEAQNTYQQRMERERKELEQAHLDIVKQMESKIYELENTNKELTDHKYKNESSVRELKNRSEGMTEELQRLKRDVAALRKENNILDADYHEQEKLINQLKTNVAVLEQGNRDKEIMLSKQQDLLDSEHDQRKRLEDEIDNKSSQICKMEASMKTMSEELAKGNEIIKKLQGEMRNYHAKVKLRNQIATEQEKLINGKEVELEETRQELAKTKQMLKEKADENGKLNESLESTVKKLEESKQLLKTNENVINWLNKQITEAQLSQQRSLAQIPSTTSTLSYRPLGAGTGTGPLSRDREPLRRSAHMPFTAKQAPIAEQNDNDPEYKNKENLNPILDAKYLQRADTAPLREGSPSAINKPPPTQLTKSAVPKSSPSAYFPTKQSALS